MNSYLLTDPAQFMQTLLQQPEWFSLATAQKLDQTDPLNHTATLFNIEELIPFAGHSLGPLFQPALEKIEDIVSLQFRLHEGHFPETHPDGHESGNWFDSDRHQPALKAAKTILGFADDSEFIFTANGLSTNLGMLMDTFFRPTKTNWETGKTKIIMLDKEFFSDQAEAVSVVKRAIQTADNFNCFEHGAKPTPESQIIKIPSDAKGLYNTETIIQIIREHAKQTQMICLSDVVFSTGQRLKLHDIFTAVKEDIEKNDIIVSLDLAHTVGNRIMDLKSLPVTFAVGCGYKHLSGFAGSGFGIYVNKNADLQKYPPLQGWKAADSKRVFPTIDRYDPSIMSTKGALAFRASNPAPAALAPAQTFLMYFNQLGFDKCMHKSECLTRYLIAQLKHALGDKLDLVTPENPAERGAMIVFRVHGLEDAAPVETFLKIERLDLGSFEIDVRPPNNIRLTAHYGYTSFEQIVRVVDKLVVAIEHLGKP